MARHAFLAGTMLALTTVPAALAEAIVFAKASPLPAPEDALLDVFAP